MSGGDKRAQRKDEYFGRLQDLLQEYPNILIVGADNVGSSHMQKIRMSLRGQAVLLMGKNTMIRKAIRLHLEQNQQLDNILPYVRGNVGFVFTKGDLNGLRKKLLENRVGAPAKAGAIAPSDVHVPKGPTGMEPTMTSFLHALNIPSKINKGQIEILNDVFLIKAGDKVGNSEASLLQKLNIKPFSYGLTVLTVYDNGSIYDPSVLDLTDADLVNKFQSGVANIASLSLEIGYPTLASLPHSISNAYKNVLAVSVETDYTFKGSEDIKKYLADPSAFASAAPAASAPAAASSAPAAAAPAAAKVEEKDEDEDDDMFGGGGLFGDD